MARPVEPQHAGSLPSIQHADLLRHTSRSRHSPPTTSPYSLPHPHSLNYPSRPAAQRLDSASSPVHHRSLAHGHSELQSPAARQHGSVHRSDRSLEPSHIGSGSGQSTPAKRPASPNPPARPHQSPLSQDRPPGPMGPPEQTLQSNPYQPPTHRSEPSHGASLPSFVTAPTQHFAATYPHHTGFGAEPPHAIGVDQGALHYGPPPHGYPSHSPYHDTGFNPVASASKSKTQLKQARAFRACDRCRERKSKCDELRPQCNTCKENNEECVYRETTTSKSEKVPSAAWESMHGSVQELAAQQPLLHKQLLDRLDTLENVLRARSGIDYHGVQTTASLSSATAVPESPVGLESTAQRRPTLQPSPPELQQNASFNTAASLATQPDIQDERQVVDKHVTAAHKLLYLWPSIHRLARNARFSDLRHNYPLHGEARGWLRVDGAGEEMPEGDGSSDGGSMFERASFEMAIDSPQVSHAWSNNPNLSNDSRARAAQGSADVVDLSPDRVLQLFASYRQHFHVMHPILDMDALEAFRKQLHGHMNSATSPHFSSHSSSNDTRPAKRRKMSDAPLKSRFTTGSATFRQPLTRPNYYPRSSTAAIFFLVLALGEIAEYQSMIPGPYNEDTGSASTPRPALFSNTPTPIVMSRPSPVGNMSSTGATPTSIGHIPSPTSSHGSPRSTMPAQKTPLRNLDVMPGMLYYHEGVQILGLYADSNSLAIAQAKTLAGLYKGQLGRSQESWSWIHDAARMVRLHARLHDLEGVNDVNGKPLKTKDWSPQKSRYLLTFWTVLMLERSDILAELDYPSSGLSAMTMPMPDNENAACRDQRIMIYYNSQIWLRKSLNDMHKHLYGSNRNNAETIKNIRILANVLSENEETLINYRLYSPNNWNDNAAPATDILDARLRGKFYGALYVSLRPFLDYALHAMERVRAGESVEACGLDAYGRPRSNHQHKFFAAIRLMPEDAIKDRARRCVQAAIRSTIAFDHINGRQVVTNIAGTCHAQFSNMLVLCACADSNLDYLVELIPRVLLRRLLERTIRFLAQLRLCSPTAVVDIDILQHLHAVLFKDERVQITDDQRDYRTYDVDLPTKAKMHLDIRVNDYVPFELPGGVPGSFSTDGGDQ